MRFVLIILGGIFLLTPVYALEDLRLQIKQIAGKNFQSNEVTITLSALATEKPRLTLQAGALTLPVLQRPLARVQWDCEALEWNAAHIRCPKSALRVTDKPFNNPNATVALTYDFANMRTLLDFNPFKLADSQADLQTEFSAKGWQLNLALKIPAVEKFGKLLTGLIDLSLPAWAGKLTLNTRLRHDEKGLQIKTIAEVEQFKFSNDAGNIATETIQGKFNLDAIQIKQQWDLKGDLTVQRGEIFIEPIYVAVTATQPINSQFNLRLQGNRLEIRELDYKHQDILALKGQATFGLQPFSVDNLVFELPKTDMPLLYETYLRSWLEGHYDFALAGSLAANVALNAKNSRVNIDLFNINLRERKADFGVNGLTGAVRWTDNTADAPLTDLRWEQAYFSKIGMAASSLQARLRGKNIDLIKPLRQPVLDGAVHIEQFKLREWGTPQINWELSGKVQPVSLAAVSTAFNGLALQGQIGGTIPAISYRDKLLKLGGTLTIDVFDGNIIAKSLLLRDPFGNVPILQGDITIEKINLGKLTGVYQHLGSIQGELSGKVEQLKLVGWQPVSFDAHFYTSPDSRLPRRISQKAVRTLANIGGGGAAAVLSSGVLSLFENFTYSELGWRCRLQNDTCYMSGVGDAPQGFYLVKGGGLPRIDIIGYSNQVDWDELLTRLRRITAQTGNPLIK